MNLRTPCQEDEDYDPGHNEDKSILLVLLSEDVLMGHQTTRHCHVPLWSDSEEKERTDRRQRARAVLARPQSTVTADERNAAELVLSDNFFEDPVV
jgi:hypothetical protein